MSGQQIGSIAGAIIGNAILPGVGGFIGAAIGGYVGSQFDPAIEGPRLSDLRIQSSEYGRPIPIVFGTVALQGNVIWASDLVEVANDSGGKGGPEVTNFTYYANFAVAICEGPVSFGRDWAGLDKRLIWDGATLEGADSGAQVRFYSGSEDQLPDPLIESYMGVGNVPAYRGTAYIVFEHFPVVNDGNRLPFITAEVGQVETSAAPENLGIVWIQQVIVLDSQYYAVLYHGSYYGMVIRRLDDSTLFAHYTYPGDEWHPSERMFYDADRQVFVRPDRGTLHYTTFDLATGDNVTHTISAAAGGDSNPGTQFKSGCYHNGMYIFAAAGSPGVPERVTLYVVDPDTHECVSTYCGNTASGNFIGPLIAPIDGASVVYGASYGTPARLSEFALSSNFTPVDMGEPAPIPATYSEAIARMDPNTGLIWSVSQPSAGAGYVDVCANDPATHAQVYSERVTTALVIGPGDPVTFVPGTPNKVIISGTRAVALTDMFLQFDADGLSFIGESTGGYHGTGDLQVLTYNPVTDGLMGFRYAGWITYGDKSDPTTVNFLQPGSFEQELDNRYLGARDGRVSPHGQPLSEVVLALSERAGLDASQVDVTQLEDDMVDGYAIANQMDVKSAIDALRPVYFFDAVESGGLIKYVKRGGTTVTPIDDDELGAYESGSEPVDDLDTTRIMDEELPRIVTVRYLLEATNYDTATKIAKRLVGNSGSEASMDLPLVLKDRKAQEVAEVNLHGPWVARITYRFSIPRKYGYLEPTDIVAVKGYTMRIVTIKQTDGRYQVEAVHDDSNVYVPNVVVTETPPAPTAGVETTTETVLELM
jgi:hypothetical protein